MANPNIVSVTDIRGKTDFYTVLTTPYTLLLNASASGQVFKMNTIWVTNTTTDSIYVSMQIIRPIPSGGGGPPVLTTYLILSNVLVPTNSVVVLVSKDASFYLLEGDDLQISASATGLRALTSYEVIS
ncbi:MAG: hypothetical protein ACO24H_03265 [Polynucleobacter sp.]